MKKIFTLAAAGAMALASAHANAQVVVDGQLTATELTGANYKLIGTFTNPRGFGDWGLLSLYAASTTNKVYFFVGGTVEANGNAFQLFLDLPGVTGALASPAALPTASGSATSFQNMAAKLDMAPDMALALKSSGTPNSFQIEAITYSSATMANDRIITTTAAPVMGTGTSVMLPATNTVGAYARLAGAVMAYRNSSDGKVLTNPGNTTPNTGPAYGGAGSFGWEMELDRSAMGILGGTPVLTVFALQNNGDGGFLSSDFIPRNPSPLPASFTNAPNLGSNPDFALVPGRQAAGIQLTANSVLGTTSAAEAAVALAVYPNPVSGSTTVAYNVGTRAEQVNLVLTDLLGRPVTVLASGLQAAGLQSQVVSTANVAAGTYLLRVQVGDKVATRKVVLL